MLKNNIKLIKYIIFNHFLKHGVMCHYWLSIDFFPSLEFPILLYVQTMLTDDTYTVFTSFRWSYGNTPCIISDTYRLNESVFIQTYYGMN